jgi:vacuolar-type H+-ATPase subunit H
MKVHKLIDEMEDIIDSAWKVPMLSSMVIMDANEIMQILKKLRLSLPEEIIQAKNIISDQNKILENARHDCESVYKTAEKKVREMIDEHEIVKKAELKANKIMKETNKIVKDVKDELISYLDNVFLKAENCFNSSLSEIKKTRKDVNVLLDENSV